MSTSPPMATRRAPLAFVAMLLLVVVALVASAILLVDYVRPGPVFCTGSGGCGAMRQTSFAHVLGVPTPAIGLAGFAFLGISALFSGRRARVVLLVVAALGAMPALGLIAVQIAKGAYCIYCMATDGSMLLLLGLATHRMLRPWDPPGGWLPRGLAGAAFAAAIAVPLGIGFSRTVVKPLPVPESIAQELAKTPTGKITVVDFIDFECPYCRLEHAVLSPLLKKHAAKLRVVRKHVPLTHIHPHALDAARACVCAEQVGRGDAFADALVEAPEEELTREGCERIAESLGIATQALRACVVATSTDARIEADRASFKASGGHGLPTVWVGPRKLEGAQPPEVLARALDEAVLQNAQ